MDLAGLMTDYQREDLSRFAYEIYANKGPQITILTVPNMQGQVIEEFSIRVAEKWQLGTKEQDNGLLIVIAKEERKVRIEVGNGIEGEITDYDTTQFTQKIFPDYFRRDDYYGGVRLFMQDVAAKFQVLDKDGNPYVRRKQRRQIDSNLQLILIGFIFALIFAARIFKRNPLARGIFSGLSFAGVSAMSGLPIILIILIMIVGFTFGFFGVINVLNSASRSRGGYGGGGFGGGGGGWSGGGGGFSGGGSSGSW